jgi:predicted nucleotidyltransferase
MVAPVCNRSEALGRLADLAPDPMVRGVTSLRFFGSAGRDSMTEDSDVDILVEL